VVHENWGDQEGYGEFWFLSGSDFKNILKLIDYIEKNNVRNKIKKLQCPFGDGKAAKRIVDITSRFLEGKIKIKETSFEDMLKLYRTL
jgi:UDP-N-acetylglucosamine 2-epimerase